MTEFSASLDKNERQDNQRMIIIIHLVHYVDPVVIPDPIQDAL